MVSNAQKKLIEKAENVYIMGHSNGDVDSIGSSLGLYTNFHLNLVRNIYSK